jgi:DNA-binding NarL/FixJ family response regulator
MGRLWVFSPNVVMAEALVRYLASLGFSAQAASDGASAAVFDLTAYDSPLPPAPNLPCLAIVRSGDPGVVVEVGALGYLGVHRPCDDEARLVDGLAAILSGQHGFMPIVAGRELTPNGLGQRQLTARETEVLSLLMLGLPNKRIAHRLGITERTIKHHVSSLMRKYNARGRLGLFVKSQATHRS